MEQLAARRLACLSCFMMKTVQSAPAAAGLMQSPTLAACSLTAPPAACLPGGQFNSFVETSTDFSTDFSTVLLVLQGVPHYYKNSVEKSVEKSVEISTKLLN